MPADDPRYTVNVDVAVRRERASPEYLFIVRGEDEDHAPGTLGFPGGTMEADPGEAGVVAATAAREVREEVGVEVANVEMVTSTVFELDTGRPCLNVLVVADYDGGEAHVAAPDEVGDVAWRTPESVLADEATPPWTREFVEDVTAYREQ